MALKRLIFDNCPLAFFASWAVAEAERKFAPAPHILRRSFFREALRFLLQSSCFGLEAFRAFHSSPGLILSLCPSHSSSQRALSRTSQTNRATLKFFLRDCQNLMR